MMMLGLKLNDHEIDKNIRYCEKNSEREDVRGRYSAAGTWLVIKLRKTTTNY